MHQSKTAFVAILGSLFLASCASDEGGAEVTPNIKLASNSVSAASLQELKEKLDLSHLLARFAAGQTNATGLTALKYYITQLNVCESLTVKGTGYSNSSGCLSLITNSPDSDFSYTPSADYTNLAAVARTKDSLFVNLMDETSRATLTSKVTAKEPGTYNWGVITWVPVMKVKGSVTVGSQSYVTHDGTVTRDNFGNYRTVSTTAFTSGTAEEAVILSGNGGNYFRFQSPFVISQADIDAKTAFAVDLTLQPDAFMKVYDSSITGCGSCTFVDAASNQFSVPMLMLTPVARKASDRTIKETYTATVSGTSGSTTDNFDLRLEIYYIESDTNKTVYGAVIDTLVNSNTTTYVSNFPRPVYISTGSDGTLTFKGYLEDTILSGLTRKTTANQTTTATVYCSTGGGFSFAGCSTGQTKEVTFTLQSVAGLK